MVGILLVSHSNLIVQGTLAMIRQMVGDAVPIEIAGGTATDDLGTDMHKIKHALNNLRVHDGILVFTDIGSSILMTEMVIDNLAEEGIDINNIILVKAPLVEGSIIAAVEASLGKNILDIKAHVETVK